MKKIILITVSFATLLSAFTTKVVNGYAVSVYDENKIEENIQAKRTTQKDYNGICYSKIYIFGKILDGHTKVLIGKSLGHKVEEHAIHKNHLIVGKEMIFKHYGVTKGYFHVYFNNDLLDMKTFVK